jgi:hypothetical protein
VVVLDMSQENNRRAVDPILNEIKESVDRIDNTIHGNGSMGLKTRVYILWYGVIGVSALAGLILTGCALFL